MEDMDDEIDSKTETDNYRMRLSKPQNIFV